VLLGDGEIAEGSVWEAAHAAVHESLDSLCAIVDVNGLGQKGPSLWNHDIDAYVTRWQSFGWHVIAIDGHDMDAILSAFDEARSTKSKPTMIIARTVKGKGISFVEGKNGWHGKPLKKGEEADGAIAELETQFVPEELPAAQPRPRSIPRPPAKAPAPLSPPSYALGDKVATREAYGSAIARLGTNDERVVALDADVGNSTFSEKFEKEHPRRFFEAYIAEQVMIGAAMGLAARGAIPFPSTFAAFLSRASDFIRMAAISNSNIKMAGSHAGVSIGEDGPSQMALEDLAMMRAQPNMTVLYPCDAVSTDRLVERMAYHGGPAYMRTSRPKTPVIYGPDDDFHVGGLNVLREAGGDEATVIAAGVTLFEALEAYDLLSKQRITIRVIDLYSVQPIDTATLVRCARETKGRLITVEDHYVAGGIGDAVAAAVAGHGFSVHRLAVREIPRSGAPEQLLDYYGISARHIVDAVTEGRRV
jgi:transketolase